MSYNSWYYRKYSKHYWFWQYSYLCLSTSLQSSTSIFTIPIWLNLFLIELVHNSTIILIILIWSPSIHYFFSSIHFTWPSTLIKSVWTIEWLNNNHKTILLLMSILWNSMVWNWYLNLSFYWTFHLSLHSYC